MHACVDAALLLNGAYDVACALCMLWLPASRLGRLHLSVLCSETETAGKRSENASLQHRVLAYWVLTYGLDRIVAGASRSRATDAVAALSYLVEVVAYYNEGAVSARVHARKARFVCLASLVLSAGVALRMLVTL